MWIKVNKGVFKFFSPSLIFTDELVHTVNRESGNSLDNVPHDIKNYFYYQLFEDFIQILTLDPKHFHLSQYCDCYSPSICPKSETSLSGEELLISAVSLHRFVWVLVLVSASVLAIVNQYCPGMN